MEKNLLAWLPFIPLLGALGAYVFGLKHRPAAGITATVAAVASFAVTVLLVLSLPQNGWNVELFTWMDVRFHTEAGGQDLFVPFAFRFDNLAAIMCLVITGIGSLIHLYSTAYMKGDGSEHRFFCYLNLFLFSMLLLVLGANLPVLFVGWEGVGLCSYLLIGFWFTNANYAAAGRKAFIVNRIGDAAFLIGTFALVKYLDIGSLDFQAIGEKFAAGAGDVLIPSLIGGSSVTLASFVALCLFIGATGKSAQIPLFVWLPDAMAGPTPVSALIHAATMVTAGIYLIARLSPVFAAAPVIMAIVCVVAALTAFIAATIAVVQNDIKKVLAYSTVSQLGFMFLGASSGVVWVGIFHLVTHAFFKACLFLGAGSVIHGCHHEQDMRHLGGLSKYMPITFVTYLISTLAIAGIYPFAGYHSKHAILAALEASPNPILASMSGWLMPLVSLTAGLTAFYMTRSLVLTFFGSYRGHAHPHESPLAMTLPLIVLSIWAIAGGIALEERLPAFVSTVVPTPEWWHPHHASWLESIKHSWIGILGVGLALFIYLGAPAIAANCARLGAPLRKILEGKYFFDEIYQLLIVDPLRRTSNILWSFVDVRVIDGTVNGTAALVEVSGEVGRATQTGDLRHYCLLMFAGSVALLVFYFVL